MNDFAAALRDLNECGVRYVVVGGLAVIRHGVVRGTKDVDIAVAMDDDNLAQLSNSSSVGAQHDAFDLARPARRRPRELLAVDAIRRFGTYTFGAGPQCAGDVRGTHTATVSDSQSGASAQASVIVSGGGNSGGSGGVGASFQCDPPRSLLTACHDTVA